MNISAPVLNSLALSKNQFSQVPLCVCSFTTLTVLDLSENPNIKALPFELGMLSGLVELNLSGLKRLKEPPKNIQSYPHQCIHFLQDKLGDYADGSYCMQLMILGSVGKGKKIFASKLQSRETVGEHPSRVCISEWKYRPNLMKRLFQFRMWVFNSLEDYCSTHQCFLSQRSLYLLLFNLKHGSEGVHELKDLLDSIVRRAPYSAMMIIGIHQEEMPHQTVDHLLQQAEKLSTSYGNKLEMVGMLPVDVTKYPGNIPYLQDAIYTYAINYPHLQRGMCVYANLKMSTE